jgi:hypothetical protein
MFSFKITFFDKSPKGSEELIKNIDRIRALICQIQQV